MERGCIYIKVCNGMKFCRARVIMKNKCDEVVFEGITDDFGKVRVPICDDVIYKLYVLGKFRVAIIPLIARNGEIYCVNIGDNGSKSGGESHLSTIWLIDENYPNIKMEGGEITLWRDIQSQ